MGLFDKIRDAKIRAKYEKRKEKDEKRLNDYKNHKLAVANEIYEDVRDKDVSELTDYQLATTATGFFGGGFYKKSEPFFDELIKRKYKDGFGLWAQKAASLFYFGYDGVERDMVKAGEAMMMYWEQNDYEKATAESVIGSMRDSYCKTNNLQDHQILMVLDKTRVKSIMEAQLLALRDKFNSKDMPYGPTVFEVFEYVAFCDLDRLGYWNVPRSAQDVIKLFSDAADKGDAAAMYWLASCYYAGIVETDLKQYLPKTQKLIKAASEAGYIPAMAEYYRYRDSLPDAERQAVEQKYEELTQQAKQYLKQLTPDNIVKFNTKNIDWAAACREFEQEEQQKADEKKLDEIYSHYANNTADDDDDEYDDEYKEEYDDDEYSDDDSNSSFRNEADDEAAFMGSDEQYEEQPAPQQKSVVQKLYAGEKLEVLTDAQVEKLIETADHTQLLCRIAQVLVHRLSPDTVVNYGGGTLKDSLEKMFDRNHPYDMVNYIESNEKEFAAAMPDSKAVVQRLFAAAMQRAYSDAKDGDIFATSDLYNLGMYDLNVPQLTLRYCVQLVKAGQVYAYDTIFSDYEKGIICDEILKAVRELKAQGVKGAPQAERYLLTSDEKLREQLKKEIHAMNTMDIFFSKTSLGDEKKYLEFVSELWNTAHTP